MKNSFEHFAHTSTDPLITMPIYQYKCADCGHQMEALQKMSDPILTDCPECNAPALKKQVTAAAFKLKGTGWYETDFKNSGKAAPKTSAQSTASDQSADSGGASDKSSETAANASKPVAAESGTAGK